MDEEEGRGDADPSPPSPIPVLGRGVGRPDAAVAEPRSRQLQLSTRPEDDLLPPEARHHPLHPPNKESYFHELGKLFKIGTGFKDILPVLFCWPNTNLVLFLFCLAVCKIFCVCVMES